MREMIISTLELVATLVLIYGALVAVTVVFALVIDIAERVWGKK